MVAYNTPITISKKMPYQIRSKYLEEVHYEFIGILQENSSSDNIRRRKRASTRNSYSERIHILQKGCY